MEKNCGIVEDLLPLYIDGICSDESKKLVEEHKKKCQKCEVLWMNLKSINVDDIGKFERELDHADEVLKEVSLNISRKAIHTALGILGIVLYWLIYFWMDNLAMYGDYRYFSYQFYEMYGLGWLLVPIFTIIWLVRLLYKMIKYKTWKKDFAVVLVVCILFAGQFGIYYDQSQKVSVTALVTVKEIVDEYHVVIHSGDKDVLLTVEPMVATLFETDTTMYLIGYESYKDKPHEGKLFAVWSRDINNGDVD